MSSKDEEYLAAQGVGRLATINEDGSPHASPLCYVYNDGKIFIATTMRLSARNLKRDPRASFVVDTYHDNWEGLVGVIAYGTAEVLNDGDEHEKGWALIDEKYPQHKAYGRPEIIISIKVDRLLPVSG